MATQIRPNRLEVSDRFPMLGFTVRTDGNAKRYEIAIGTSPDLFGPDGKSRRSRDNFFSTRAAGPLPIERGEAVYVVPPEVLARFVGQQRIYYGLATFNNGSPMGADVATMPGAGSPYVNVGGLTGRSLQRVRLLPNRQRAASSYGKTGSEIDWAGDAMTPGTQPAAPPAAKNGSSAAPAPQPVHYDDGYGPLPVPPPPVTPKPQMPRSASLASDIPLDPGIGGQSVGMDALQVGDIILSTTDHISSTVIRAGSGSQVSHAMLYVGQGGQVVEAVGGGVRLVSLNDAVADSNLAVAFRVPGLSSDQGHQVADSIAPYIGRDYDYVGVVRQGLFQIDKKVCSVLPDGARQSCENWAGRIDLGRGNDTDFFCSALVVQAFADAGMPITSRPGNWNSPQDIAELAFKDGLLSYVGHLKAPIPRKSLLDVFGMSQALSARPTSRAQGWLPSWDDVSDYVGNIVLGPVVGTVVRKVQGRGTVNSLLPLLGPIGGPLTSKALDLLKDYIKGQFKARGEKFRFSNPRKATPAESETISKALLRGAFAALLGPITALLDDEYSVGIGITGEAGVDVVGAGAEAGIILTSGGHFGLYGEIRLSEGIFEGAELSFRISILKGGIEKFNEPSLKLKVSLFAEIGASVEIVGDWEGNIIGVAVGLGVGEELGAFFSEGAGRAVQLLGQRTVPAQIMSVRALDSELQPATLPAGRKITGWEKTVLRTAVDAAVTVAVPPVSAVLPTLISMANEMGYTVGLGLGGDGGLLGGAGLGFGILLAPNNDLGVFGSVEIRAGLLAGLGAGVRVIVVKGGIETFNETGYAVGVTIEEEASISVIALFNSDRKFHGVSFQLGVGVALSPIQIYTATEKSVSTAITQSLAADEGDNRGIEGPIPDSSSAQSLARGLAASPEYPGASRFEPAASSNYSAVSGTRTINRIVIHITDGGKNINGTIGWFKNPDAKVSAHYVIGQDGEVVQMVNHNDKAWHASSANGDSIGIEHVANTKGLKPTAAEYCASAALVNWLCNQFSIPMDRDHILGHSEADPKTSHKACPNAVWDWESYMPLVKAGGCAQEDTPSQAESLGMRRRARGFAADTGEDRGIEGPIPDQGMALSLAVAPEYPGASRFDPASPANYRAMKTKRTVNRIVIHITDGGNRLEGTVSWFKNPEAKVSAHYVVGQDGTVVQMLKNNDMGWHASGANPDSIGIEHVANSAKGKMHLLPSVAQYCASAALVNWLCNQYNLPIDRTHVLGHSEADPGTTHEDCPNSVWDWDYYMPLVQAGGCAEAPDQTESLAVRLPPPPRRKYSRGQALDGMGSNTVTGGEGNIAWTLDQYPGIKMGSASAVAPLQAAPTIKLSTWPYCDHDDGSCAAAWFTVDWKFSGQTLGQVRIAPAGTKQGSQPLRVEGRIEDGRMKDPSMVSLVVRFTYRFATANGPEAVAVTELILNSDGTTDQKSNWITQS